MRLFFILLLLNAHIINAQFVDDFSDNDFSSNPAWIGNTGNFLIDAQSSALKLNAAPEAGVSYLFTQSNAIEEAVWEFSFRMGFNPSASNYAQVYIASDANNLNDINNAFYLVLGTTADNVSLWVKQAGINTKLIDGLAKRFDVSIVEARIRVTRNKDGEFVLESDIGQGWVKEGSSVSNFAFVASWFGISCHYTATRSALFWFDDFVVSGNAFKDTIAPKIEKLEAVNRYKFLVKFSKPIINLGLKPHNFILNSSATFPRLEALPDDKFSVLIEFLSGDEIPNGNSIKVSGIKDDYGNALKDTVFSYNYSPAIVKSLKMESLSSFLICFNTGILSQTFNNESFLFDDGDFVIESISELKGDCFRIELSSSIPNAIPIKVSLKDVIAINGDKISDSKFDLYFYQPIRNDIVISEIMHSPSLSLLLPDSEYLEIYNRGEFPVSLNGFTLKVGTRETVLGDYLLFPHEYLLLVPSTQIDKWDFVSNKLAVSSWPLLPNAGGEIVLRDAQNYVITALKYNNNMGQEGFKREGGYSLEIKDVENLSGSWDNWDFSDNTNGGTPGAGNSLKQNNNDVISPYIEGAYLLNDSCIVIEFSKAMSANNGLVNSNIEIDSELIVLSSALLEETFLMNFNVCFSSKIPENIKFNLSFTESPLDLAGNSLQEPHFINFGVPVHAATFDVVINELLFDPPAGGDDFVELYNRSDKLIDVSSLFISRNNNIGIPEKLIALASEKRFMFPGDFLVFTNNKNWILDNYSLAERQSVHQNSEMPNYVNGGGTVFLTDVSGKVLDSFTYSDKMHYPLLSTTKGVSLERINTEVSSQDAFNWHSASASFGYATPATKNSQATNGDLKQENTFTLEPDIFIPNQNGIDDLLFIKYLFDEPGYSCTVKIFNRQGRPVRSLVNNSLTGTNGFFTWDGTDDSGRKCNAGIYVVYINFFNLKGDVFEEKHVTVLGADGTK
jgi:hypothetical protein